MSLFEWLGETRNPGPIGFIESGSPQPVHGHPRAIVVRGILAVFMAVAAVVGIAAAGQTPAETFALAIAAIIYCAIAYWVRPRPDLDNVGWAGGLINNPFRWSDNANRFLVFLGVILWPGRFLTVSLRDVFRYWRGERLMVLPPRE